MAATRWGCLLCAMVFPLLVGSTSVSAGMLDWVGDLIGSDRFDQVSAQDRILYEQRADDGDPESHLALGVISEKGMGVPQSWTDAHIHYNLAASLASHPSQADIRNAAERRRKRVEERMTPEQIGQAQSKARDWRASFDRGKAAGDMLRTGQKWVEEKSSAARRSLETFWSDVNRADQPAQPSGAQ